MTTPPKLRSQPAPGVQDTAAMDFAATPLRMSGGHEPTVPQVDIGDVVVDRFELLALLGVGGMGAVFEAEDRVIGRRVAVKILRQELSCDPTMAARFQQEARAASMLGRQNVVTIYDVGADPSAGLFIVMELLEGESLGERLEREGHLPPTEAAAIAAEIAKALAAAHHAGVVHRDLKPDNVFMLQDGGLKVLDFGIAKILEAAGGRTTLRSAETTIVGTPMYISPEVVRGESALAPADLYSLGVMLFEMVAGQPPFDAADAMALCHEHVIGAIPSLAATAPGEPLPPGLDALVAALMQKEPAARPSPTEAVLADLTALAAGAVLEPLDTRSSRQSRAVHHDTEVVPRTPLAPEPPPERRRKALLVGLAVAVFVVGFAITGVMLSGDGEAESSALPTLAPTSPIPVVEAVTPVPDPVEVAPETSTIAVVVEVEGATFTWDGAAVESPFTVPRDEASHRLEVTAPGHRPSAQMVAPTADQTIEVALERLRRRRRGSSKARPNLSGKLRSW